MVDRVRTYRVACATSQALLLSRRRPTPKRRRRDDAVRIFLLNAYGMGGAIRAVFNLAGHLAQSHPVEIVSLIRRKDEPFFPFPAGVRITVLDDQRPGPHRTVVRRALSRLPSLLMHPVDDYATRYNLLTDLLALRTVRTSRSGVLITTRPAFNVFAGRFARAGVTAIAQEHTNLRSLDSRIHSEVRRQYRKLDAVVLLTERDSRDYEALLSGSRTAVVAIPNAVPPLPGAPSSSREKVIVAAGRLYKQKGFDLLLRAFKPIAVRHPDWRLHIYGSGPEQGNLESLVSELELAGNVSLLEPERQLGKVMAAGSVYALSSRWEGFPMVILEAMSKGMAIVAFDCPTGPREIIEHDHNGLLVPAEDVAAFTAELRRVIEDGERRRRLGEAATTTAKSYDVAAIGGRWDDLLVALGAATTAGLPSDGAPVRSRSGGTTR